MRQGGRGFVRGALVLVAIVVTVLTVENVVLDNGEVRALAAREACGDPATKPGAAAGAASEGPDCMLTSMNRSPLVQEFEFTRKSGASRRVACRAAYVVAGPYRCGAP